MDGNTGSGSEIKNRIFQLALKIPTVNKHLPVFPLGTENVVGGWMAILVVVCGKNLW